MLASILWNYVAGLLCAYVPDKNRMLGRVLLVVCVSANVGMLFFFKYLDFSIQTVNQLFSATIPLKNIALPIGISFFTFQGLSYVVDVYQKRVPPQRSLINMGMYISMFPQLIAGPIVRYADVEQQIATRSVSRTDFYDGVNRFITGLSKKTILANTLAYQADSIFGESVLSPATAWLGAVFYTLQIYFDFSGYSDMAIGLGKMLGFSFPENFNLPYLSKTMTEFWRRWHISLSTWFRDYVYIPLGGNRRGNVYFHLIIVFFLTGLWHGASWNFVLWGLWHGLFLILERLIKKHGRQVSAPQHPVLFSLLQHGYTMLVVLVGWVLFRADSLSYAMQYFKAMLGIGKHTLPAFSTFYYLDGLTVFVLLLGIVFSTDLPPKIAPLLEKHIGSTGVQVCASLARIGLMLACAGMTMASVYNPFIYFRF
ncbi:MBOAT family O-acyltransferase [Oscillibacter valericigenes]|nr:MBOAT family O-acyltransferase [Oscillibacter valericigenes]